MDTLDEVKSYMRWYGWTDGGNPGSVKVNSDTSKIIARYGDETWIADVGRACATLDRVADATSRDLPVVSRASHHY